MRRRSSYKLRSDKNLNVENIESNRANSNSRNDKRLLTQVNSQPSLPTTAVQNTSQISTSELTPLLKPMKIKRIKCKGTPQTEINNKQKSNCLVKNLKIEQRIAKSFKLGNPRDNIEFNKAFSKTFLIMFQFLKLACKQTIPTEIFSSYKSGMFNETKNYVEEFMKLYSENQDHKDSVKILKCLRHMIFLLNSKLTYNFESENKNQQLIDKFIKFENKYSYQIDKVLCNKTFDNRKCSLNLDKSKSNSKIQDKCKPKFLKRIQIQATPESCRLKESPNTLNDLKLTLKEFTKPKVSNRESIIAPRLKLYDKISSRVKNVYNCKVSLRSASVKNKRSQFKVRARCSSTLANIKQEAQSIINSVIPTNTESALLKKWSCCIN